MIALLFVNLEVDALLVNHLEGFRNWVKPEGEMERVVPGDDAEGMRGSWGLNALDDGAPRRGAMDVSFDEFLFKRKDGVAGRRRR